MNYGFLDAHNLAWKLHLVECGFLRRSLLNTYEGERKLVAAKLLEFDATYANLFSSRQPAGANKDTPNSEFVHVYKQNSFLTSGYGVEYPVNSLIWPTTTSPSPNPTPLRTGRSYPTATVTRVIDARPVYLEQEIPFNGSYRIYIFAGRPATTSKAIFDLADNLQAKSSIFRRYQRNVDISYEGRHNPHSPFFTFSLVFYAPRSTIEIQECLPDYFACYRYHVYADDREMSQRGEATESKAHVKMGFDADKGGIVVVRPDGYVGCVLDLSEGRTSGSALNRYFEAIVPGHEHDAVAARL